MAQNLLECRRESFAYEVSPYRDRNIVAATEEDVVDAVPVARPAVEIEQNRDRIAAPLQRFELHVADARRQRAVGRQETCFQSVADDKINCGKVFRGQRRARPLRCEADVDISCLDVDLDYVCDL